jgi:signal transduction histidine kinase/HAMP domain-containing protein
MAIGRRITRALKSIRGRLYLAFLVLSIFMAAFGVYAIDSIRDTSALVTRTYDKPLMAINFARSAQFGFAAMDQELGRLSLSTEPAERAAHLAKIAELRRSFDEDLKIAEDRSLSPRSVATIREIRTLAAAWHATRERMLADGLNDVERHALDDLAAKVIGKFDLLIDLTAGDGFLIRQDALKAIDRSRVANTAAIAGILALTLVMIALLARSILRPLGVAARVAQRIAQGELDAKIPKHGEDETGALLRSLEVMQNNLRAMMAQEVALRKTAQAQLADALESSSDGVVLIDAGDRILTVNSQVHHFFPDAAHLFQPGRKFRETMREAQLQGAIEMFTTYDATTTMTAADQYPAPPRALKLPDGRWLQVSRSAARSGGSVVIWTDITELRDREETLKLAKETAEKANQAKTSFLANISHELRTPLNAIIGFSELIESETFGPVGHPQYATYARDIRTSGDHLLGVINDILDMSHSESGRLYLATGPLDFAVFAKECMARVAHQCAAAGQTLKVDLPAGLPEVEADPDRLRQIVLNLTSNAIKFTPRGGRISFSAVATPDCGIEFCVADSGIGMKQDDLSVALEPFRQIDSALSRRYEGAGLGLPLTKTLVELHGGSLRIESEPGQGTRVIVGLPPRTLQAEITRLARGAA